MKILADQVFATLGLPWDSKLSNLTLDEDRMIVETIPEYLVRVDLNSRYLGLSPVILFPAGTYEINDFLAQCKNYSIYKKLYIFDTTIEDIGLVEWTIPGVQGIQGIAGGEDGAQGTTGTQGGAGATTQGTQGTQGSYGVQGHMGTLGLQGIQGHKGSQGLVGYGTQGAVGTVTEVQGIQGKIGIQGYIGTLGIQGVQGTRGLQGTQSAQGAQGNDGVQGLRGIQGIQGVQGSYPSGVFVDSITATDDPQFPISYLTYQKGGIQYAVTEIPKPDGIISGGYVNWITGLTFGVSATAYYLNALLKTVSSGQVTLSAAHPTYDRIDVIAVNNLEQIVVITGVPGENPQKPTVDPQTQIELTQVLIPAGSTIPYGVITEYIYNENVEWVGSSSGVIANFASTTSPFLGTLCTNITNTSNDDTVTYTKVGTVVRTNYTELVIYIKLKAVMTNQHYLYASFMRSGSLITNEVVLPLLDKNNITTWQNITIPLSSFTFSSNLIDALRFRWRKNGSNIDHTGFYLDLIKLQAGLGQPPIPGAQGAIGSQGTQGSSIQGTQGTQGFGIQGAQGIGGFEGTQGLQGFIGSQGIQGESIQGVIGSQGLLGIQGLQGLQGLQGGNEITAPYEQSFTATAGQTNFTLTYPPIAAWVWKNGLVQDASTWSIFGNDIVLSTGVTAGVAIEIYYLTGILLEAGIQGTQGNIGAGSQGVQGAGGFEGTQGIQGFVGSQGIQGNLGNPFLSGRTETLTAWTLALTDANLYIECTNADDILVTIPKTSVVDFPLWTVITLCQMGTGSVTVAPVDEDVTTNAYDGLVTYGQYAGLQLVKVGTNSWDVIAGTGEEAIIAQGTIGSQGAIGSQGIVGSQGNLGAQGIIGTSIQGVQGTLGIQGLVGGITYEDLPFDFNDVDTGYAQTYILDVMASFNYTIISAILESDSTMDDLEIQIGTTSVTWTGSVTSIDVTTNTIETTAITTNSVSTGNRVKLVTSGTDGGSTLIRGKLKIQRT